MLKSAMHELSLCRSIFGIVDTAREGREVDRVHLRVGMLRQVVPETLEHCWGLLTAETALEGSRLVIDHVPVQLRCTECGEVTVAEERLIFVCRRCDSTKVELLAGEEFMVTTMDVRTEPRKERSYG